MFTIMGYQLVGPIVRFFGAGWGKAECEICRCVVKKRSIILHAEYHADKGERTTYLRATYRSHNDVTVAKMGKDQFATQTTGWMSAYTGPR